VAVAELAHEKFLGEGGEYQVRLLVATTAIDLAKRKLALAERQLRRIAEADGDTHAADDAEFACAQARVELQVATAQKKLLETHVLEHQTAVLELATTQARMDFDQARADGDSGVKEAAADLEANKIALEIELQKLKRIEQQIKGCMIHAPAAGTVIYANVRSSRTVGFTVEPGASVSQRQVIVRLLDLNRLQVKTLVSETRIDRVRVGQVARVRCDAFPDRTFAGRVTHINRTPEPASFFYNGGKEYAVTVAMDKPAQHLRIGMTALVEINVSEGKE
jgi:multidrug resistance efflux pump